MPSVPEGHVVGGCVDKLMLRALAFYLAHTCKTERIKLLCIGVARVVAVSRVGGRTEKCPLGNKGAVSERDIFQCLALHRD